MVLFNSYLFNLILSVSALLRPIFLPYNYYIYETVKKIRWNHPCTKSMYVYCSASGEKALISISDAHFMEFRYILYNVPSFTIFAIEIASRYTLSYDYII